MKRKCRCWSLIVASICTFALIVFFQVISEDNIQPVNASFETTTEEEIDIDEVNYQEKTLYSTDILNRNTYNEYKFVGYIMFRYDRQGNKIYCYCSYSASTVNITHKDGNGIMIMEANDD